MKKSSINLVSIYCVCELGNRWDIVCINRIELILADKVLASQSAESGPGASKILSKSLLSRFLGIKFNSKRG